MNEDKEKNIVRTILRSEITWVGMVLVTGWSVVVWVIIPISNLQQQMSTQTAILASLSSKLDEHIAVNQADHDLLTVVKTILKIQ